MIGDERAAVAAGERLVDAGYWVPAVRYPTVSRGAARLRLTVSAAHRADDITGRCRRWLDGKSGFVAEVGVGLEVAGDVVVNGGFERGGLGVVTGGAEFSDVGAGVVLILSANGLGHVDEVDGGFATEGGKRARARSSQVRATPEPTL